MLISYEFPPTGGSGVHRPAKLSAYLPQLGWACEVLSAGHDRFPWHDETLFAQLPSGLRIHRVAGREPACLARALSSRLPFSPAVREWVENRLYWRMSAWCAQPERGWARSAIRRACLRHQQQPFNAVISTGPPQVAHEVAAEVSRRCGIPWLADVRDPLCTDFYRDAQDSRQNRRSEALERHILEQADLVVTTCPSLAEHYRELASWRSRESVACITNGFDRGDLLAALEGQAPREPRLGECHLVAGGAFYGRRELRRIIEPITHILQAHPAWASRVRLTVAGTIDAAQRTELLSDCPPWVDLVGYLDHPAAIRLSAAASCTIIMVPECRHGRLSIPGKTFELLALPAHILGLVPPGSDTEQLLARAGGCTLARLEDQQQVRAALEAVIAACLNSRLSVSRPWPQLEQYERRRIAGQFASGLERICGEIPEGRP